MCRWGCEENASTFMCKWCGTRYCRECLKGEFVGVKKDPSICIVCNQGRCQGKRVEVYPPRAKSADKKSKKFSKKSGSRSRSASPAKKSGKKKKKK